MNGACVLHIYLLKTYMYIDIYSNEIYIYTQHIRVVMDYLCSTMFQWCTEAIY